MIKSFKHKGLEQFFKKGITKGLRQDHVRKINGILWELKQKRVNHIEPFNYAIV